MSLTQPSVGEYLDRFSILRLKIHHGSLAGKDVTHFERERDEILGLLPPGINFEDPAVEELAFANECIWELTDAFREAVMHRKPTLQATYGRLMVRFNDKRSRLIQRISEAHGDTRVEKLS